MMSDISDQDLECNLETEGETSENIDDYLELRFRVEAEKQVSFPSFACLDTLNRTSVVCPSHAVSK